MEEKPRLVLPKREPSPDAQATARLNEAVQQARLLRVQFNQELQQLANDREAPPPERQNSMQSLLDGLFFNGQFTGAPYQEDTQAMPFTLANANSYVPISLNRILLSYSYMTQGLLRTVVDQPVEDAFRGGISFKSDELDDKETKKLTLRFKRKQGRDARKKTRASQVNANAGYDLNNSDLEACKYTAKWARLYGGAGMIVATDQDFRKELDVEKITEESPLLFIAADRWELILNQINVFDERLPAPFNYYGLQLHRSRVSVMNWAEAPSYIRMRLQGWGMSILEECIRAVNSYIKFENLLFELLDEAKIDVYKIKGLNTSLASDLGTQNIQRRVVMSNQLKNFQNALSMDAEDDYSQKQLSFSGLAEIKEGLRTDLCAYLKFPKNKLFGESAGGFSSGKDSLDNYNSMVECVREQVGPLVLEAAELRCQQMFGFTPEDLELVWSPLDLLDGVEQESVKTSKQSRITQQFQSGLITAQEASHGLRAEGLLTGPETEVEAGLRDVDPLAVVPGEGGEDAQGPKPRQKNAPKVPTQGSTSHQ